MKGEGPNCQRIKSKVLQSYHVLRPILSVPTVWNTGETGDTNLLKHAKTEVVRSWVFLIQDPS